MPLSGPVGFMGLGDLCGFNLVVLIFYKSRLGFMGIYGRTLGDINPHKSFQLCTFLHYSSLCPIDERLSINELIWSYCPNNAIK